MAQGEKSLDIVIPIYNESENIKPLLEEITSKLVGFFNPLTVILVDDGSIDDTPVRIENIIKEHKKINIKYYRFTRNYGKEIAVKCGIDQSGSEFCSIMDGDLQHPPESLIEAYGKLTTTDANIIYISPKKRTTHFHQKLGAFGYKKILNTFSKAKVYLTDFTLMDKKTVDLVKQFNESDFYTRGILSIVGLVSAEIHYTVHERKHGKTKFSFAKLINLAIDGVISVSTRPLRMAIYAGVIVSILSILFGMYLLFEKLILGQPIPGFATMGFGMFFLGGIQLLFLGLIGEYVGKTFIQAKKRPLYTIDYKLSN
jgi:glycosyltransferase involved in cell wall biosynthesis